MFAIQHISRRALEQPFALRALDRECATPNPIERLRKMPQCLSRV